MSLCVKCECEEVGERETERLLNISLITRKKSIGIYLFNYLFYFILFIYFIFIFCIIA